MAKRRINYVTVCPARIDYIKQLELLNYCLIQNSLPLPTILIPSYTEKDIFIQNNLETQQVDIGGKNDDLYHDKFALKSISQMNGCDFFLYLDPDHLVFDDISLDELSNNTIWVSSEENKVSSLFTEIEIDYIVKIFSSMSGEDPCYNSSFIFCNNSYFTRFLPYWEHVYNSLYRYVNHRHLEELSLSIAAKQFGFNIKSVDNKLQSCLFMKNRFSRLFHYGGSDENAYHIKSDIVNTELPEETKYQSIIKYIWG